MRRIIVVEFDQEAGEIGAVFLPDSFDELFWADAVLFGPQHDRGAVRVVGAEVITFVAARFLKADPNVGLNVFHQMTDVDRAVGVG